MTDDIYEKYLKKLILNEIQYAGLKSIESNEDNVLVCAPTGSGKTLVAILGIIDCITKTQNARIFYVAPIKALLKEITREIDSRINSQKCGMAYKIREISSDTDFKTSEVRDTDVCVGTPEKLDILLRKGLRYDLIIIDEIHLLNSDRGNVIEAIVSRTSSRIIGLSATIPNLEYVCSFLRVPK